MFHFQESNLTVSVKDAIAAIDGGSSKEKETQKRASLSTPSINESVSVKSIVSAIESISSKKNCENSDRSNKSVPFDASHNRIKEAFQKFGCGFDREVAKLDSSDPLIEINLGGRAKSYDIRCKPEGFHILAKKLMNFQKPLNLNLSYSGMTDDDFLVVCEALKTCSSLRKLDIEGNNLSIVAINEVSKLVTNHGSLLSLKVAHQTKTYPHKMDCEKLLVNALSQNTSLTTLAYTFADPITNGYHVKYIIRNVDAAKKSDRTAFINKPPCPFATIEVEISERARRQAASANRPDETPLSTVQATLQLPDIQNLFAEPHRVHPIYGVYQVRDKRRGRRSDLCGASAR